MIEVIFIFMEINNNRFSFKSRKKKKKIKTPVTDFFLIHTFEYEEKFI